MLRPAVLPNYQRVFSLVSIAGIRDGEIRRGTLEMAARVVGRVWRYRILQN
jgi:hypothetical protein